MPHRDTPDRSRCGRIRINHRAHKSVSSTASAGIKAPIKDKNRDSSPLSRMKISGSRDSFSSHIQRSFRYGCSESATRSLRGPCLGWFLTPTQQPRRDSFLRSVERAPRPQVSKNKVAVRNYRTTPFREFLFTGILHLESRPLNLRNRYFNSKTENE